MFGLMGGLHVGRPPGPPRAPDYPIWTPPAPQHWAVAARQIGGYVRVPLRSKGGNLAAQSATLFRELLACGNAAGSPRCGDRSHGQPSRTGWVAAMITPTTVMTVAVVLGGVAVLPCGRAYWVLLAWILHLPPSAVPLVSDVRFRRSA